MEALKPEGGCRSKKWQLAIAAPVAAVLVAAMSGEEGGRH
jgi:hypothetical protein